ncbi:putative transcriptional regulator [Caenispirillum salinarum AK4]|uniref:Putative transcriptional regulator n=1 Tax=Caenispirillum salinarum AK4 TaxID=1238182 RepID=K9GND3_9PROT|nr:LuxR C-terminal-related transcriptional regulator [Caenispirillum salinarum]EKV26154.1 putative transcriptional regulator [Caenispirillum salinarum AK4]
MPQMDDAVALLYETVETPALWTEAVAALTAVVGAEKGAMFGSMPGRPDGFATSGYPAEQVAAYQDHHFRKDLWAEAALRRGPPSGEPCASEDLVPEADLVDSAFYNDYLRRFGDRHGCGLNFRSPEGAMTVVNFVRGPRRGPFGRRSVEMLRQASPHIARAMTLRRLLGGARAGRMRLQAALDGLIQPVLVVDRRLRVLEMNSAAERFLSGSKALRCRAGVLGTGAPSADRQLARLVADAVAATRAGGPPGGAVLLDAGDGDRVEVAVTSVRSRRPGDTEVGTLALVAVAPWRGLTGSGAARHRFMEAHGLTPSEAGVLGLVAQGHGVPDIAARLGLTTGTVKSYLKSLHAKLECNSRHALVARALRSPAWWIG